MCGQRGWAFARTVDSAQYPRSHRPDGTDHVLPIYQAFYARLPSFCPSGTTTSASGSRIQNLGFNLVCALRLRLETIRDKFFVG